MYYVSFLILFEKIPERKEMIVTIFVYYPECSCVPDVEVVNVIIEVLPPLLMGLDLASSRPILESAGVASVGQGEALSSFSQKTPL